MLLVQVAGYHSQSVLRIQVSDGMLYEYIVSKKGVPALSPVVRIAERGNRDEIGVFREAS